jgi:sarcosine oxidase subunit gamma
MIKKELDKMTDQMISSPLISKEDFQANGVNLTSTEFVGKLNFRCNSDNTIILNKIKDITGINLPLKAGEVFGNNEYRIQWLGPNEWIIQCADNEKNSLMNNIRSQLSSEHFSLTDISDYYLTIRLSGSNSNEILSKGTPLDLKSYICNKDMCAQTYIAKATVLIDRLSNEPMYDISVRWSYAEYLWEWLVDASYEFTE